MGQKRYQKSQRSCGKGGSWVAIQKRQTPGSESALPEQKRKETEMGTMWEEGKCLCVEFFQT